MRNSRLKKHLLMILVFVALWALWMIGVIPDATLRVYGTFQLTTSDFG